MRASTFSQIAAVVLLLCQACNRSAPAPTTSAAPPAPAPAAAAPVGPQLSLGERLAEEARTRPAGAVTLEALVATLKEHGVDIARTRQVLGSIVGARYCAMAMTSHGLGFAACEYDSPDAAQAGMAASREKFDPEIPGRTLVVNGQTLLTVAPAAPALTGEAQTTARIFASLAPR